jgi:hypothetical protein
LQHHLTRIAFHLGITIIRCSPEEVIEGSKQSARHWPMLPNFECWDDDNWPHWCPAAQLRLPDYVPDVVGGHSAPVKLTPWKVKAIHLLILLERNGAVSRRDMKGLGISPTRWTDHFQGFLRPGPNGGYVACGRTPDLKAQHPTNWAEIEADFDTWIKDVGVQATLAFGPDARAARMAGTP